MGLLLLENKDGKFELHLYNDFLGSAMMMTLDIRDFANMCDALGPYFQREQIEI